MTNATAGLVFYDADERFPFFTSANLQSWYQDADNDTYGNPQMTQFGTIQPTGYVANNTDCNDNPANGGSAIHPGAAEICNGIDDDCNGNPEAVTNTWTGLGDSVNWSHAPNWSDGIVPLTCQDVVIPTGNVTIGASFMAVGKTLNVALSAVLTVMLTGVVDIHN